MKTALQWEALAAVVLAAAPAFAQAGRRIPSRPFWPRAPCSISQGHAYDFAPKADGAYAEKDGMPVGTYRADGRRLCVTPTVFGRENCFTYPAGKTSGDTFEVQGENCLATVTIR